MADWEAIAKTIALAATGEAPRGEIQARPLGGGSINHAYALEIASQSYFVKLNHADLHEMFVAEAEGLAALRDCGRMRVPDPIAHGVSGRHAWLALEYIPFGAGRAGSAFEAGRALARMHLDCRARRFGWHRDNTIGSTHQPNAWRDDWIDFWRDNRLGFQLEEAARNGYRGSLQRLGGELLERFPALIDHNPAPSLLHGDLWGGNIAYADDGQAVIFDPATYYGDAETDLAMTELFGGFGQAFHDGYRSLLKPAAGSPIRKVLYNLYHILNHTNLFGGGYAGQAQRMMERLLAELR